MGGVDSAALYQELLLFRQEGEISSDVAQVCPLLLEDHAHAVTDGSEVALAGALELISAAGGGLVEAFPQDTDGKKISASFLYNGTRGLFEQAGFDYERPKGKNHCVMTKRV